MKQILQTLLLLAVVVSTSGQAWGQPSGLPVPNRPEISVASIDINTSDDEFAAVPLRGATMIIYTSSASGPFSGSGDQRIWMSTRTSAGWGKPETANEAMSRAEHVGSATLSPDGNYMIFAAYEWKDDSLAGSGRTDLYAAEKINGQWGNIKNLGPTVNGEYWDSQPALSSDGRLLYFASDRAGGRGGTDIYMSRRVAGGGWTAPVSVGGINSATDDLAPTISPDSKTLFFSSDGYGGVGGFDIFVATAPEQGGSRWGKIENIGTPINSKGNDYFFASIPNSKNSFLSSDRDGSMDIFTAYPNPFPPEALVTVGGTVIDAKTKRPVAASITVTDLSSGEVISNYKTDDVTGEYYVILTRGRRYSITAEAPDYIFYTDEYRVSPDAEAKDIRKDIELYRTSGGTTRLLVFFDFDRSDLKDESKPELNRGIAFLRNNPTLKVEIAGHTDSVGTVDYNHKLSHQRAESVRQYIIAGGIAAGRITAKGYGEDQPITDNGTEEGKARNRRVEMRVIE